MIETTDATTFEAKKPPFVPLPSWLRGALSAQEIGLLWILQSYYPDIRPSLRRLVAESRIGRSSLFEILRRFEAAGLLVRERRTGENGEQLPSRMWLRIWEEGPPAGVRLERLSERGNQGAAPIQVTDPPRPRGGHPPVQVTDPPRPRGGPELDKEQLDQEQEEEIQQPNPPTSPPAARGDAPQAAPVFGGQIGQDAAGAPGRPVESPSGDRYTQQPIDRASCGPEAPLATIADPSPDPEATASSSARRKAPAAARDPFASKTLPPQAVPDDLLDCQQLLAEWWAVKARGRTRVAFDRACAKLRRHSPDDRQRMLEDAVVGGWQGLFEPRGGSASGSGQARYGGSSLTKHARNALAAIQLGRAMDAGLVSANPLELF